MATRARELRRSEIQVMERRVMMWKTLYGMLSKLVLNWFDVSQ
jgi:hypothetical protein